MTLIFKRKGCDMIMIYDPEPATVESYCKQAAMCVMNSKDLEVFQLLNHTQKPIIEVK